MRPLHRPALVTTDPFEGDILSHFTTEEIRYGIEQFAQVKLRITGEEFIAMVRRGDPVDHLHRKAQEVADLVAFLPEEAE